MANPMTIAAPAVIRPARCASPVRGRTKSHNAAKDAPMAIAIEARKGARLYVIIGRIWMALIPE
jgi:hypothetical protein